MNRLYNPENYRIDKLNTGLGAVLMVSYFTRLQCGIFGDNPVPEHGFIQSIWIEAGYDIDAPDLMPAGGMTTFIIQEGDEPMPEQITLMREAS